MLFFIENVESDEIESLIEEDHAEEFEREQNVIINSSDESCEENDEYESDTIEELNEKIDQ